MERLTVMGTITTTKPKVCCSIRELRLNSINYTHGYHQMAWVCLACNSLQWSYGTGHLHIQSCDDPTRTEDGDNRVKIIKDGVIKDSDMGALSLLFM